MMQNVKISKGKKGQKGRESCYDIVFRRKVALVYKEGDKSMLQVAQQFGLTKIQVKSWVRRYKPELALATIKDIPMTAEEQKEVELLKKQLEALKEKLEYEEMKNFALETMIDLAKEKLGVDLRKNSGAKQPGE